MHSSTATVLRVDNKSTGRINADQLLDLFEKLGLPISVNDAVLLIRKINGGEEFSTFKGKLWDIQ